MLSDLSQPLREEERQALQRLIRVIGHEMNNSLAPIKSIAGSLSTIIEREPLPSDWRDDVQRGLSVIASRSESLSRFMSAYARLAKLPPPKLAPLDVGGRRRSRRDAREGAQHPDRRRAAPDDPGRRRSARAAADQPAPQRRGRRPRNRRRASASAGSGCPARRRPAMELWVDDEGPGLSNTGNLFVPFFTTKPGGSGIGLVLQPADRRSARRQPDAREPRRSHRLPRQPAAPAPGSRPAQARSAPDSSGPTP